MGLRGGIDEFMRQVRSEHVDEVIHIAAQYGAASETDARGAGLEQMAGVQGHQVLIYFHQEPGPQCPGQQPDMRRERPPPAGPRDTFSTQVPMPSLSSLIVVHCPVVLAFPLLPLD